MNSVIIINGSPRKDGNTAKMCRAFAEGVKLQLQDATVETVNLYDFDFKGCRSCFACKLKGSKNYGHCSVKDSIMPILEKAAQADILVSDFSDGHICTNESLSRKTYLPICHL